MKIHRILAIIIAIIGVAGIGTSVYINKQIEMGKQDIKSGEKQVESGKKLFKIVPETAPIGELFTGSAEERLEKGKRDISHYESLSKTLRMWGIILVILGILLYLVKRKK